jgi:hypothetical protein
MDKVLHRYIKHLQEISEAVSSFKSEAVQLKVIERLLPIIESSALRAPVNPENVDEKVSKAVEGIYIKKDKKPGLKKSLIELIQNSFFSEERSIGKILEELNSNGYNYVATQVSGILLALVNEKQLDRYQSKVNNRYVYLSKRG